MSLNPLQAFPSSLPLSQSKWPTQRGGKTIEVATPHGRLAYETDAFSASNWAQPFDGEQ